MTEEEKKSFDEAINKAKELTAKNEALAKERDALTQAKSEAEAKAERYHNEALAVALSAKKTATGETQEPTSLTLKDLGL